MNSKCRKEEGEREGGGGGGGAKIKTPNLTATGDMCFNFYTTAFPVLFYYLLHAAR